MDKRVFYSFHFGNDCWRAGMVRNMGVIEGNQPVSDNDWEEVKKKGDSAIKNWIDKQLENRSCTVVLIGLETSSRKWVKYEIERSWALGKGVVGIYIDKLEDQDGKQSSRGSNPFYQIIVEGVRLSTIVKCFDSEYLSSQYVYGDIKDNLSKLVESAITIRNNNL